MFNDFKIKFKNELTYTQVKEVFSFLKELSLINAEFISGSSFLLHRGKEADYALTIENEKIIINLI